MQISETLIRDVVSQVLAEVGRAPVVSGGTLTGRHGVFHDANEAVQAARAAFEHDGVRERPNSPCPQVL